MSTDGLAKEPLVMERTYNAPIKKVWEAITDKDKMKLWYFDLEEFRPEIGFEFQFYGGTPDKQYLHLCRITDVVPGTKLTHTWNYEGISCGSLLTFELFPEGEKTRLKLTHAGIDSFPKDDPNFAVESFTKGWTYITGESLVNYLEKEL